MAKTEIKRFDGRAFELGPPWDPTPGEIVVNSRLRVYYVGTDKGWHWIQHGPFVDGWNSTPESVLRKWIAENGLGFVDDGQDTPKQTQGQQV